MSSANMPGRDRGSGPSLDIRPVESSDALRLGALFDALAAAGDERTFHPHSLTHDRAREICRRRSSDVYMVATTGGDLIGYGMLRGWEEGYEVPSLGIAVHPEHRHRGVGRALMSRLHEVGPRGLRRRSASVCMQTTMMLLRSTDPLDIGSRRRTPKVTTATN